jgi:hypothetical protein
MRSILIVVALVTGCGASRFVERGAPARPFDAVIVPGCPNEDDGSLSRCQMARAVWAAKLWDARWTRSFIVSGAAVHSPFVEAEGLAAALAALGVPPDRIWLEPNALHTDENMIYSLQLARRLGYRSLAVASNGAAWDCLILADWGQSCRAFEMDLDWVRARHQALGRPLTRVRMKPVARWTPIGEREHQIAVERGRHRSPSFLLYLGLAFMRSNGEHWVPPGLPSDPHPINWAMTKK